MLVEEILAFWLDEVEPKMWYANDKEFDALILRRFGGAWQEMMDGSYGLWLTFPSGALAYIILADQFSRNMFRDQGKAFSSDRLGLAAAKSAIKRGWDLRIDEPARQFFYLPLMHSENLCDQDRCVRLIRERMGQTAESNLLHAKVHREVIRKFGRFPYRNMALGRRSTAVEQDYIASGGYGSTLNEFLELQPSH